MRGEGEAPGSPILRLVYQLSALIGNLIAIVAVAVTIATGVWMVKGELDTAARFGLVAICLWAPVLVSVILRLKVELGIIHECLHRVAALGLLGRVPGAEEDPSKTF